MNGKGLISIESRESLESKVRMVLPGKPELLVGMVIDRLDKIRRERGLPAVDYDEFEDSVLFGYDDALDAKAKSDGRYDDRLFDDWGSSSKVTRSWSGDDKQKAIARTEEAARREAEEQGEPKEAIAEDKGMSKQVVGNTAYALLYKNDPPLTDAQTDDLIAEYARLGLRWVKCTWNGVNALVVKAPAAAYVLFDDRYAGSWQSIRERVGYSGGFISHNNCYMPGSTAFVGGKDWNDVVAFIDKVYDSASAARRETEDQAMPKKRWWQFWK